MLSSPEFLPPQRFVRVAGYRFFCFIAKTMLGSNHGLDDYSLGGGGHILMALFSDDQVTC